jgi:hypothetical protein
MPKVMYVCTVSHTFGSAGTTATCVKDTRLQAALLLSPIGVTQLLALGGGDTWLPRYISTLIRMAFSLHHFEQALLISS